MDNTAELYDLVTVLMSLQSLEGMGGEIGRGHPVDDELGVPATDVGRTGFSEKCSQHYCRRDDAIWIGCGHAWTNCVCFAKESDNPNSVVLIQKRINEFVDGDKVPAGCMVDHQEIAHTKRQKITASIACPY